MTDTKKKEFKILYPETEVKVCGTKFTIRQWSALQAKNNAKKLQGPFVKLAGAKITDELINEIIEEAFEDVASIIAEDFDVSVESALELPAPEFVNAFKGILEANMAFFDALREIQTVLPTR